MRAQAKRNQQIDPLLPVVLNRRRAIAGVNPPTIASTTLKLTPTQVNREHVGNTSQRAYGISAVTQEKSRLKKNTVTLIKRRDAEFIAR